MEKLSRTIQAKVAVSAIGASALRGQGAPGVVEAARRFLGNLDLRRFSVRSKKAFLSALDKTTTDLLGSFPPKARHWGAARKALNLFLRDSLYNYYLREQFKPERSEAWFEVPLDSAVAKGLSKWDESHVLPRWPKLVRLDKETNNSYQAFALECAIKRNWARVHLDAYLWLKYR